MLFVFMDLAIIWIGFEKIVVDTVLARTWRPAYAPSGRQDISWKSTRTVEMSLELGIV